MATSVATAAFGTLLKRGDGGGPEVFTTIAEIRSIDGPSLSIDFIDVTHMESPSDFREVRPLFKDGGEITCDINFLPANATQNVATGILQDFQNKTRRNFEITWTDTGATTWSFAAYVTGFSPSAPFDDRLSATLTLKVDGAPTLA